MEMFQRSKGRTLIFDFFQFYLAVANYGNGTNDITNSTIFKWHRHRKKFREYQRIPSYTARDMEFFEINNNYFLAVANHAKGRFVGDSLSAFVYFFSCTYINYSKIKFEPRHEKTCLRGLRPGKTQPGLLSYRS